MADNRPLYNGQLVNFTVAFTASSDKTNYTTYILTDTLAAGLSYTAANSNITANGTALTSPGDYSITSETIGNQTVVTATINNNNNVAGNNIVVTIGSTVTDMTKVVSGQLANTASIDVNGTAGLNQNSNSITVDFETFQSYAINNTTSPNDRAINAVLGDLVEFDGSLTAPNYSDPYNVTIQMQLPTGTTLSTSDSTVLYGTTPTDVDGTWSTLTGNVAQYSFTNSSSINNELISIVLKVNITDNHAIENSFNNTFDLSIGENPTTTSNTVTTIFIKPLDTVTKAVVAYTK
ncbi:isopeptide-forming domain-containing fimbrial protein [Clostridium sp.]|uniref:isopeptide-forming domain-containing fimbrial protein n=1 Tax=Clostridium sp. TaxID=1506 RepID=UPI003F3BB09A